MSTHFLSDVAVQTVRNRFNFCVTKRPLTMQLGTEVIETPCFGLFRDDNWEFVGDPGNTVSDRYQPHTTEDVIALVDATASVFEGENVNVKCHWRNGHYVTIAPGESQRREIARGDGIYPRMMIQAGYDGKAFRVSFGTFRERCTNLMMTEKVSGLHVSIKHNKGTLRDKMDNLLSDMGQFDGKWDGLVAHWNTLRSIENISVNEFLVDAFTPPNAESSQNTKTRYANMLKSFKVRLVRERYNITGQTGDENKANGWELFNAVQGYMQHDMTRKNGATRVDRAIMVNTKTDDGFKNVARVEDMLLQLA